MLSTTTVERTGDLWVDAWSALSRRDDEEGTRIIQRLVRHGCEDQVTVHGNRFGNLLQHQAALGNCSSALETIMSLPTADIDKKNKGTSLGASTSLHWAATAGHLEATRVLVRLGADKTIIDHSGHTALALALDRGFGDVADILDPEGTAAEFERGMAFGGARKSRVDIAARVQKDAVLKTSSKS